ncbi:MAG: hypothetical protein KGK07_14410 [Chloroflexota bacterium]|nr:hypothetical protein [Chloroflexota bacterium]
MEVARVPLDPSDPRPYCRNCGARDVPMADNAFGWCADCQWQARQALSPRPVVWQYPPPLWPLPVTTTTS